MNFKAACISCMARLGEGRGRFCCESYYCMHQVHGKMGRGPRQTRLGRRQHNQLAGIVLERVRGGESGSRGELGVIESGAY